MLSFIVQRSFVTINSQCRAFMAVKSLGGSLLCYKNTPHTSYFVFPKPVHTIYSGPVRHLWPLIICEWFEMFGKHWGLCMRARSPWRPSSVWSAVMGGSCGEVTREIWLKSSHWRPHTNFRDVTFHPNRQVNQSKWVFIVSLYSSSISDQKERNTSTCLYFMSVSSSGLSHYMTSDRVRHLHSSLLSLLSLSSQTWRILDLEKLNLLLKLAPGSQIASHSTLPW